MYKQVISVIVSVIIGLNSQIVELKDSKNEELFFQEDSLNDLINTSKIEQYYLEEFSQVINQSKDEFKLIPEGTSINRLIVIDQTLMVDFSEGILCYGGSAWEEAIVNKLLDIAFSRDEIDTVVVLINGKVENFVEGTLINGYTRKKWEEGEKHE